MWRGLWDTCPRVVGHMSSGGGPRLPLGRSLAYPSNQWPKLAPRAPFRAPEGFAFSVEGHGGSWWPRGHPQSHGTALASGGQAFSGGVRAWKNGSGGGRRVSSRVGWTQGQAQRELLGCMTVCTYMTHVCT